MKSILCFTLTLNTYSAEKMASRGGSRCRGRGTSSEDSGSEAAGSSIKNESKSKQEKALKKKFTQDQERKVKDKQESKVGTTAATPSKAKVARGKEKADIDGDKSTSDNKAVSRLIRNVVTKKELGGKEQEAGSEALSDILKYILTKKELEGKDQRAISEADVLKIKYLVGEDSVELEKFSSKAGKSTNKGFLACASPLPAKTGAFPLLSELLQVSKHDTIEERKRNLDPIASKGLQILSLENEKKVIETKSEVDVSMPKLQYSRETDERELNLYLKASKVKREFSSENEKEVTEAKFYEEDFMPVLKCSQVIDERKLRLGLKTSKVQQEFSSENENKVADQKFEVDESMPLVQYSKDTDELKLNSDMKASKVQQEFSSENESKIAESKPDGNESPPMLQCSKDIDERKLNLDLKTSNVQQELTEKKSEVFESQYLFQDSKLMDIKERIQNLDLNASNTKQVISAENPKKLIESENEEYEGIINLRGDENLRFEFDTFGNKKVLVDDKDQYTADKKQKMTFYIGDGNVQLSFIDNKVCIFSQSGEIDCSIQNNRVVFSLTDSTTRSDSSPEGSSTNEQSHSKDTEVVKYLGNTNVTGTTKKGSLPPSEEMHHESVSKNVNMSTLKTDSSFVPRSVEQERLQNITHNFLGSFIASFNDFESVLLKCLNQKNEDTNKE